MLGYWRGKKGRICNLQSIWCFPASGTIWRTGVYISYCNPREVCTRQKGCLFHQRGNVSDI